MSQFSTHIKQSQWIVYYSLHDEFVRYGGAKSHRKESYRDRFEETPTLLARRKNLETFMRTRSRRILGTVSLMMELTHIVEMSYVCEPIFHSPKAVAMDCRCGVVEFPREFPMEN